MAAAHAVVQPPFVADQILQCGGFGLIDRVAAIDPGIALGAVVVDQQQPLAEVFIDGGGQGQQRLALQRLVETLHQ
ncbi:hypothetical protein D3C81_2289450 [compost metagenome]